MNPTPEIPSGQPCACANGKQTRRNFLFQLGVGANVLAGVLLTLPLVGYVLSSRRRKRPAQWISLGPVAKFPASTTRLAQYRNPLTRPWDGKTGDYPRHLVLREECRIMRLSQQVKRSELKAGLYVVVDAAGVDITDLEATEIEIKPLPSPKKGK